MDPMHFEWGWPLVGLAGETEPVKECLTGVRPTGHQVPQEQLGPSLGEKYVLP